MALTGGRPSAEAERWILWELPMARAYQYLHAAHRRAGNECRWARGENGRNQARESFQALAERWKERAGVIDSGEKL